MNARTVLIKIDSVMMLTGESADAIYEKADGSSLFGGYKWVFNVASNLNGEIRDLRFWVREIMTPNDTARFNIDQAIREILPLKRNFHSGDICNSILCIRRPTLKQLRQELSGNKFFPRAGLEQFLRTRWLGGCSGASVTAANLERSAIA